MEQNENAFLKELRLLVPNRNESYLFSGWQLSSQLQLQIPHRLDCNFKSQIIYLAAFLQCHPNPRISNLFAGNPNTYCMSSANQNFRFGEISQPCADELPFHWLRGALNSHRIYCTGHYVWDPVT